MPLESFPANPPAIFSAMGFDYGTKRIGTAYGQNLTGTSKPLSILKAKDGIPDWDEVERLIRTWQPLFLVVGLPYNMDGSESELLHRATKFGNRLNGRFHLPCYGIDERLSSQAAAELSTDNSSDPIDSLAAGIILQSWFAELKARQPK